MVSIFDYLYMSTVGCLLAYYTFQKIVLVFKNQNVFHDILSNFDFWNLPFPLHGLCSQPVWLDTFSDLLHLIHHLVSLNLYIVPSHYLP